MSGVRTLEENIRRLEEASERADAVVRELNSVVKEARKVAKELRSDIVGDLIHNQVKEGLDKYAETIGSATKAAHDHVLSEFNKLLNLCMHGNEEGDGPHLVHEWIKKIVRDEARRVMLP